MDYQHLELFNYIEGYGGSVTPTHTPSPRRDAPTLESRDEAGRHSPDELLRRACDDRSTLTPSPSFSTPQSSRAQYKAKRRSTFIENTYIGTFGRSRTKTISHLSDSEHLHPPHDDSRHACPSPLSGSNVKASRNVIPLIAPANTGGPSTLEGLSVSSSAILLSSTDAMESSSLQSRRLSFRESDSPSFSSRDLSVASKSHPFPLQSTVSSDSAPLSAPDHTVTPFGKASRLSLNSKSPRSRDPLHLRSFHLNSCRDCV
jgi:hypothetical protein